jgi:hypothetical protein
MCEARRALKMHSFLFLLPCKLEKQPNGKEKLSMKKYISLYGCYVRCFSWNMHFLKILKFGYIFRCMVTTLIILKIWPKDTNMCDVVVDKIKLRLGLKINKKKIVE